MNFFTSCVIITLMDTVINLQPILDFLSYPAGEMLWRMFLYFGWIPIGFGYLWGSKELWLKYRRGLWFAKNGKFILLAIDIPKGNMQSPKAVENIFDYLAGAHSNVNLLENYWEGKSQLHFSFEIVSIEGYTQFIVFCPETFRSLVETAVYSQYPDAEITEIDDYTKNAPTRFPDDKYDIWGGEFIHKENYAYPIKLYTEFEHNFGEPETHYKDPMSTLMDLCSSLRKGEELWYQILITPIDFKWAKEGDAEVEKLLGKKPPVTFANKIADWLMNTISNLSEVVYSLWGDIKEAKKEEKDDILKMMNLTPKQKRKVEGIHHKITKIGFEVKIRVAYLAKKDVMNKPKVANGFVGYMKQFAALDLNNLRPDTDATITSTSFFSKESRLNYRKNNLIANYRNRDNWAGKKPGILNSEELATIWHFPIESVVKAPLIQKAPGRKAEPPSSLPLGEEFVLDEITEPEPGFGLEEIFVDESELRGKKGAASESIFVDEADEGKEENIFAEAAEEKTANGAPPANLPFA